MKNIYLLLFSVLYSLSSLAQPVLTAEVAPEIGDSWEITYMESDNFEPGLGGPNVTWDFSDINLANSFDLNVQILDPDEVVGGPSHPTADFVWYFQGFELYSYYEVTPDSISLVGGALINDEVIDIQTDFLDPENGFQFPLTLGDSYTYYSLFEQLIFGIPFGPTERTGIVACDGFGTLITPNGTYDDLLRIVITETSFGFTSVQYAWFDVNNFVPVFLYEESDDPDTPASLYFSTPDVASPTIEINRQDLIWNAWYSKGAQEFVVELPEMDQIGPIKIQIYSLDGRLIKEEAVNLGDVRHTISFPFAKLSTVIVTLKIDQNLSSKKISLIR